MIIAPGQGEDKSSAERRNRLHNLTYFTTWHMVFSIGIYLLKLYFANYSSKPKAGHREAEGKVDNRNGGTNENGIRT